MDALVTPIASGLQSVAILIVIIKDVSNTARVRQ
jgi:hypothetical protein